MKLTFKRSGHVYLGKHEVGYLWKPDPKTRFTMGKKGVWNFMFTSNVKMGQGLRMLRDLGLQWSYTNPRMSDLKAEVREELTESRIKKIAAHCKEIEKRRAATPPPTKEEQEDLDGMQRMLDRMLGQ